MPALFVSSHLRAGHPDFLDLPWDSSLDEWPGRCERLETLPKGLSRHTVVFVNYDGALYALKELPAGMAEREYEALRNMVELRLPVVEPVGHLETRPGGGQASVLVTRYLDHSLPYHSLFMQSGLARYREHLLDALAILLVQLHVAGVFWGDCSLSNTLFRRDAGALQAYLVDAETSEIHPRISAGLREHDLEVALENLGGGLLDLMALGALAADFPVQDTAGYVARRYHELWDEVTRDELLAPGERYRIQERIRAVNALGFTVDEVELEPVQGGEALRLHVVVTDQRFHRDLLHSFTGLDAERRQARLLVNEIREYRASLAEAQRRSTPLSVAAHRWLGQVYLPSVQRLAPLVKAGLDEPELYCQLLEHKWFLSERAQRDVGHEAALEDFLRRFLAEGEVLEGGAVEGAEVPLAEGRLGVEFAEGEGTAGE